MIEGLKNFLDKIKEFWTKRTLSQKIQIIALILVTAFTIGGLIWYSTKVEYEVLFSGMSQQETSTIYTDLKEKGIIAKVRNNDTLLVPKDQVEDLRFTLISEGLPETGLPYGIYTELGMAFGSTDSDKQYAAGLQLQDYISRTIKRQPKIENADVIVTMPDKSKVALTNTPRQEAQAAVSLTIKQGQELTKKEADTIRSLVEKSVPSLKRENIVIADSNNRLYEDATSEDGLDVLSDRLTLQKKMQGMLEDQVSNLFSPIFGVENFTIAVNLTLNFDDSQSSSVKYEPPADADNSGIIISQAQEFEYVADLENGTLGNVGLDPNGGIGTYAVGPDGEPVGAYYKQTNEFNAEVNEFKNELKRAKGVVETLSIAIMVNGEEGDVDTELMLRATAKAIGVDEQNVSIMFIPFSYANQERAAAEVAKQEQAEKAAAAIPDPFDWMIAVYVLAVVIIFGIVLLVMLNRRKKRAQEQAALEAQELADRLEAEEAARLAALDDEEFKLADLFGENEGSDILKQIRKLVDRNPESVAQLLRNWLSDDMSYK